MTSKTRALEDWIADAWAERDECPPPELFLPTEWDRLSDEARDRATRHLRACAGCSAERDLAAAFEATPLPHRHADREVAALLDRVAAASPAAAAAASGGVLRFRPLLRRVPRPALTLAAAALLAVAASVVVRYRAAAPGLPDVPFEDVVRSARIVPLAPIGDGETAPAELAWRPVEDAAAYRVTLTGVDDTVLWSGETDGAMIALPAEVRSSLRARVLYFWQVEAFDREGARLAWSSPTRFRIVAVAPPDGETTPR